MAQTDNCRHPSCGARRRICRSDNHGDNLSDDLEKELYGDKGETDAQRLARETREQDWRDLLSTPGGRRIMWGLMQEFGLFTGGGSEYATGMRDCALSLRALVRAADPDKEFWRTMVMENDK